MIGIRGYTFDRRLDTVEGVAAWGGIRDRDGASVVARVYAVGDDPGLAELLEREYRLIESIRSEGILGVLSIETQGDTVIVLSEAFDGLTLAEYATQHPVPPDVFMSIAVHFARTLADVHEAGVIHKDVRPANVLIDPYRLRVRLTGFAMSVSAAWTHTGDAVFRETLPYVSPEQTGRMQRRVDYRSDLYSAGATLYQLATGHPPFRSDEPLELVHAHLAREPEPVTASRPDYPAILSRIVLKLLEKEPEDRYPSASALLRDLQRCQERLDQDGSIPDFPLADEEVTRHLRPSDQIYGREHETAALVDAFRDARQHGALRLVLVSGQPGVGKTALVEAAMARLEQEGARCVRARLDPYAAGSPYAGFRKAIVGLVDEILTGTDEELGAWRRRLNEGLAPIAQVAVELVPKLGWVVGPQPPLPEVAPPQARRRLVEAVRRLVAAASTPDRPLVLFLDDVQWADEGTLHLLEGLVGSPDPIPALLIGAYQHRDVTIEHPLSETIERLWAQDPTARALRLQPLQPADVNRLVADSVGRDERETGALTSLVARKTDNNPLFVKQFLVYAAQIGLLDYVAEEGWTWDLQAIERAGLPDDVAAMMTDKISRLPLRMQRVLKYASIAGMNFDLDTLMALDPARDQLQEHLHGLVDEGLVTRTGEGFRFAHERIREAAHRLVPPVESARLYRLIGRHRLKGTTLDRPTERVFDVVDALNRATALIQDEGERIQLIELDVLAGRGALDAGAAAGAVAYLDVALGLITRRDWEERPRLIVQVHLDAADACRRMGDTARAEELYRAVLAHNLPDPVPAEVCAHLASLYVVRGEPDRAVKVGLMGMRRLGTPIPRRPSLLRLAKEALATWWALRRMPDERWDTLAPAKDPTWRVERTITEEMGPAAFVTDPRLVATLVLTGLRGLPEKGYVGHPALYLAALAVLFSQGLGWFGVGHRVGQRALRMLEHYPDVAGHPRVRQLLHGFVQPWTVPWRQCLPGIEKALHSAVEAGDQPTAAYAAGHESTVRLLTGDPLQDVEEYTKRTAAVARRAGLEDSALSIEAMGDAAFVLRGMASDTDVQAAIALDRFTGRPAWVRFDGHAAATFVLCVLGRFEEAWEVSGRVVAGGGMAFQTLLGVEILVLRAVAGAASVGTPKGPSPREARRTLAQARRRLRRLVRASAFNFGARLALLDAERHRLAGRPHAAMDCYARAREGSGPTGSLYLRGMVLERQASLAAAQGLQLEATAYLQHARGVYKAWGADSKVAAIDESSGALQRELARSPRSWTGSHPIVADTAIRHGGVSLDLATVMDTARALSEEVHLETVVERVLQRALENAGASRGVLLLTSGDVLRVEAEVEADGRFRHYRPSLELEDAHPRLPVAVVRLVARTAETVVLEDAVHQGRFTSDPFVVDRKVRSVLCVPIIKRTKLVGVLYLENTLVARAFTEERQTVLRLVASQAAISLENARLVEELEGARDDLERRVEERTRELTTLQDDLVSAARRAGMAEVATGVLHNVGNLLNSVNTASADLDETLRKSRLPSLERTVELLRTHQGDDLARFLVEDDRGRLVPEFLRLVVRQLSAERERMQQQASLLSRNVDHIRQVISAQQAFAGVTGLVEEVDLEDVVEEAIQICGATRTWREHAIERDFQGVAPVMVERHKVLQILVNVLTNARDALDQVEEGVEPRIVVTLSEAGNMARLAIKDTGAGIPRDHLDRIFAHGFTTKRTGHGFGLHSSAIAARQLGGTLRGESEGPGRGATFILELPLRPGARREVR